MKINYNNKDFALNLIILIGAIYLITIFATTELTLDKIILIARLSLIVIALKAALNSLQKIITF